MENNEFDKTNFLQSEDDVSKNTVSSSEGDQPKTENKIPEDTQQSFDKPIDNPEKKSIGAIVGSIIIIVIIIIGGLYFWGKQIVKKEALLNTTAEDIQKQPDKVLNSLETQNKSDKIKDIEADLNATNLNDLEKPLDNINLELGL